MKFLNKQKSFWMNARAALAAIAVASLSLPPSTYAGPKSDEEIRQSQEWKDHEARVARVVTRMIALAVPKIRTKQQFADVLLADLTPEERNFVLKKIGNKRLPTAYQSGPTVVTFADFGFSLSVDFREVAQGAVFVNGSRMVMDPSRSWIKEWPTWERRFEVGAKSASNAQMDFIFDLFLSEADAGKVKKAAKSLERLETIARKAAEEATEKVRKQADADKRLAVLETQLAQLKEKVDAPPPALKDEIKKDLAKGIALAGPTAVVAVGVKYGETAVCVAFKLSSAECANQRIAVARADETLGGPSVVAPATDLEQQLFAENFEVSNEKCAQTKEDQTRFTMLFKKTDVFLKAVVKTDDKSKLQEATLVDAKDPDKKSGTFKVVGDKLKEACVPLTAAELEKARADSKGSATLVKPEDCYSENETDSERKKMFEFYALAVRRMNVVVEACSAQKIKKLEKETAPPPAPDVVPARHNLSPGRSN